MQIEFFQEKTIPINKDQTILEAALQAGIPHFHACGGKAKCSTCRVLILEGEEFISPPNKREARLTSVLKLPSTVRLACQAKLEDGPVKVERMVKSASEIAAFLKPIEQRPGHFKLKPLGEEKQLVLFFLDIRDFTPFVESYLPFDVIYLVRKLFELFYTVLSKHQGQILETAGDELYAIFGDGYSLKKAADAAIAAGFEILAELKTLNQTYGKLFLKEFEIGIGIHCGKVIVGEVNYGGSTRKTAMGLAVNIASRIQNSTKTLNNSFVVSEEVILLSSYKSHSEVREIRLAGVKAPIKVYSIGEPYTRQSIRLSS
ncbi:adenylate/guanylate cyclase domain-containing protein [Rhodocytophaga aerolata]|uniref:Adenylate/guanylate cyclase domain-containing protein n=1 Tax=Rhodocytophaga aerolata TaxID=455078 RepID=A0ABT8RH38_9BACT|nr:adenylate/guanylate cyclase domain-containing protein [Rhodocytophaga aerolata]MDO1450473.1 adenylate/guanylate cyclase domain-containing protein [Rhodocytophaga aerolata]